MNKRIISFLIIFVSCLGLIFANGAAEESPDEFPTKAIEVVVPWGAGGGTDVFIRTIGTAAQEYFGEPWTVVNRGGAGGVIATNEFLNAKNDGYQILINAIGVFSTQPKLNPDSVKYTIDDFEPIIGASVDPIVLVTNKDTGIEDSEDLIEYMENETVKWGYTGKGSLHHIGWTAFLEESGAEAKGVSYDGGGELIAALLGDHVQFASLHPVNMKGHEDSGSFVPLVCLSPERIDSYPDVPTAKELGHDLDFEVWKFFLAPKGTPQEIMDALREGIEGMLTDPEVAELLEESGVTLMDDRSPEFVEEKLRNNIKDTGEIVDNMGLTK